MATVDPREVWQRGPIPGFLPELQPVVHALMQVAEDVAHHASTLSHEELWARPFGVASVGFHLRHLAGSTDRLLTYARGEMLSASQKEAASAEQMALSSQVSAAALVTQVQQALQQALEHVRATPVSTLHDVRYIGRARLETTVWGLLFHAAEHASRHAGQLVTTMKIVRGGAAL